MKLSDEYLMTVINKLDGIGEVPWLIQKEMARELLEFRQRKRLTIDVYGSNNIAMACFQLKQDEFVEDLHKRFVAAEKMVELLRAERDDYRNRLNKADLLDEGDWND